MPTRLIVFLHKAMRWVRYAYFLRFSLGLWFFALVLCWLNTSSARTLTSGIMTPETIQQYACVGFFLVSAGFVALITARVVLINGPERWDKCYDEFDDGRPRSLKILLVNDKGQLEWAALLISQLPNAFVYLYLTWNAISSGVPIDDVFFGLLIGSAVAVVLWWVANAWYYLTYEPVRASEKVEFQQNAARTLLFPRVLFGLAKPGDPFDHEQKTLEAASTWLKARPLSRWLRWLAGLLNTPGYVGPEGHIYEGHVFSALAASCLPRDLPALMAAGRARSGLPLVSFCPWPFGLCGRRAGVALLEGQLGRAHQSAPLLENWAHRGRGRFCGVHRPALLPHQRRALSYSRHHPDRGHRRSAGRFAASRFSSTGTGSP